MNRPVVRNRLMYLTTVQYYRQDSVNRRWYTVWVRLATVRRQGNTVLHRGPPPDLEVGSWLA